MRLELQVNSRAISDCSRALEGTGIAITPPISESFWLFRVPVSKTQAIVGFPKFNVIGIGFQQEEDWNTNLPSGTCAIEIYEHIRCNRGDSRISRGRCIEAIILVQKRVLEMKRAETVEKLKEAKDQAAKLSILGDFLRKTGSHELAVAIGH